MTTYTDPGNPLFQERLNGLTAFYQSNGYDANQAYDAAINGVTGDCPVWSSGAFRFGTAMAAPVIQDFSPQFLSAN